MRLTSRIVAMSGIVACLALGAAPVPAAAAGAHTRVISSCTKARFKPHRYVLACADANIQITHATYSSWSAGSAQGHGTFTYNTCTPSCAAGTFKHHPVTFVLRRVRSVGGVRLFTRMSVSYAGLTETFQLPTSPV
jgi:hypothetical protein